MNLVRGRECFVGLSISLVYAPGGPAAHPLHELHLVRGKECFIGLSILLVYAPGGPAALPLHELHLVGEVVKGRLC